MKQFWTNRAVEFVAADAMISLLATTKASPKGNEIVQIEAIPKGSVEPKTYHVPLKYEYWRKLHAKLKAKLMNAQQKFKCWRGPNGRDDYGGLKAEKVSGNCTRTNGIIREANEEKEVAMNKMSRSLFPFVVLVDHKDLETGRPGPMPNLNPPNFASGKCKVTIYNLYNENGNDLCQYDIPIVENKPKCDFQQMKHLVNEMKQTLLDMSEGRLASDWKTVMKYQGKDTWAGCAELVKMSLQDDYIYKNIENDQCTEPFPDFSFNMGPGK
jgi:hypothetical protein